MTRGRRRGIFTVLAVAAVAVAASYWPGQKEPVVPAAPPGANGSEESSPAPWEPTDVVPLFADGKEPFADWQRPELSPGLRDESGAPGLNRTSAAFVSRPLPHDDFELSGKLEPWGKDVGGRREQLKQAGLRIVLTDGLAIEIALRPEPDGDYTGVLRWTGAGDDANHWRPEEPIAVAPTRTAPLERLSFRLLWANGDLTCTLGEGDTATTQRVRPTDRANGAVPAELVFFVEHGKFVLHDVQLWR